MTTEIVLTCHDIKKSYGVTQALKGVDFTVRKGKVTTLFGENGAGKSTLMKIISGVEQPTSGVVKLNGVEINFANITEAGAAGIAIIHQELNLAPNLTVRDNIFMGREIMSLGGVDYAAEEKVVEGLMQRLEERISPKTLVADLRLGQQQIVEIARALSLEAKILIMDEPTSALSTTEVSVLFKIIADLKSQGVAIVYISHHLEEALEVSDYCVVFRDGDLVADEPVENTDLNWVVKQMVGSESSLSATAQHGAVGGPVLKIDNYTVADPTNPERLSVDSVSLTVHEGEIVCLYGLMGAGRTELLESLAGRVHKAAGEAYLNGVSLASKTIAERIDAGLALVPEDRQRDGLVQSMSVGRNLSLAHLVKMLRGMFILKKLEYVNVDSQIIDIRVKTSGPGAAITSLSGGNQQKVVIGKILMTNPKAILLDEPTRGIDVGAKSEVFSLLTAQSKKGMAVLFATSEIGEALSAANRILVMRRGKIVAEFDPQKTTREEIMSAANEEVSKLNGVI